MNAVIQSFQGLGSLRIVTLVIVATVLLGSFTFLSYRLTQPVLGPLYSNLSAEDSSHIVGELGAMGVDFQVANSGSEILIKSTEVLRVRMMLAQKGLPNKGSLVGYEIFDKDSALGTSNFVLNVNMIRALEGELSRTISSLSTIKSARVHLVMPKRNLFERNRIEPTASVIITLQDRAKSLKDETQSIRHLVASAVPGLEIKSITLVSNDGKVLARGGSGSNEDGGAVGASDISEHQVGLENRIKNRIENLLEKIVGAGRVKTQVSAEMSFDKMTMRSEEYDPETQVARSVQTSEEIKNSNESSSGEVSVANNLPNANANGSGNGSNSSLEKVDEVTNYEISSKVTNLVQEVGVIKKLSIAVLVDGRYETVIETSDEGEEIEIQSYIQRSDEELSQIRSLVATAIGYNEERGDKIEVINMPFTDDGTSFLIDEGAWDWLKQDLPSIIKTLVVGLVAILAIMLIIRPLVQRAFDISAPENAEMLNMAMGIAPTGSTAEGGEATGGVLAPAAGAAPAGAMVMTGGGEAEESDEINVDMIQNTMGKSPAKRLNDLIDNNPEETLAVIRTWLTN